MKKLKQMLKPEERDVLDNEKRDVLDNEKRDVLDNEKRDVLDNENGLSALNWETTANIFTRLAKNNHVRLTTVACKRS